MTIPEYREVKAVILDRDGVLTHFAAAEANRFIREILPISIFQLAQRWQLWGEEVGFPRSLQEEEIFFDGFWRRVGDEFDLSPQQRRRLAELDYTRFVVAFPEVRSTLVKVRVAGLRIGVLSNFSLASLDHSLQSAGILDLVDAACAATVIGVAKPAADAYRIAAAALDVQPHECLFLDDEQDCIEGARAVNMHTLLVDRLRESDDLEAGTIHDLTALSDLITYDDAGIG